MQLLERSQPCLPEPDEASLGAVKALLWDLDQALEGRNRRNARHALQSLTQLTRHHLRTALCDAGATCDVSCPPPHAPTSRLIFMKRFATPILIVIAALIGAAGLVATAPTLSAESPEAVAPAVRVTTVTPTPQRLKVRSQGSVMPRTESALVVEVDGRIEWVSEAMVSGGTFFRPERRSFA